MKVKLHQILLTIVTLLATLLPRISGHGMVLDPVSRGSRWRCNKNAPQNVDDSGLFCGGFKAQFDQNGGKCGLCGDNYADPRPRLHELGGLYGGGDIVRRYRKGAVIDVTVKITANHKGYFEFGICDLDRSRGRETEECYGQYPLRDASGNLKWNLNSGRTGEHVVKVQLPKDLTCAHCSLQWTYVAGNNWGWCGDGTGALGCGPQEHFRTCSDISIYESTDVRLFEGEDYCSRAPRSLNSIADGEVPEEVDELD